MRRLVLILCVLLATDGRAWAALCQASAACDPGPCLASSPDSWDCGHVPNGGVDNVNILAPKAMLLDADLDILGGDDSAHNFITGTLTSDGHNRTITIRPTSDRLKYTVLRGTLNLRGGDRVLCRGSGEDSCFVTIQPGAGTHLLMDGTIGAEQEAGEVSAVGTTYTISGITTTGFAVGDVLWWTSGLADNFPYEVTALTETSVTYQTDLPDASSSDLLLTPDEGSAGGGLPSMTHSLPSLVPAASDRFRLVKPVKWGYVGTGYWRLSGGNEPQNDASNFRLNGVSIVNTRGNPSVETLKLVIPPTHAGQRQFSFLMLGEHTVSSNGAFQLPGLQRTALDRIYIHDSLEGSAQSASFIITQCVAGPCGAAYPARNVFVGNLHGTRTISAPLRVGNLFAANPPSNVVVWQPTIHDGPNRISAQAHGITMDECSNCLVYRGAVWNWVDRDNGIGEAYSLNGVSGGSVIADSYAINAGQCAVIDDWNMVNFYCSNTWSTGVGCDPSAGRGGTIFSTVIGRWGLGVPRTAGIGDCNVDGAFLLGSASSVSSTYGWIQTRGADAPLTVRNVVAKDYKTAGFAVLDSSDQDTTIEHATCGGPAGGNAPCVRDESTPASARSTTVRDVAALRCGRPDTSAWVGSPAANVTDSLDAATRDSDACGPASGWSANAHEGAFQELKFAAPDSNDFNLRTSSPLYRAGLTPPRSSRGARCILFDPSRLRPGLTLDLDWANLATETCADPDHDGYVTLRLGPDSPDSCAEVTDLRNASTCDNGETPPGKRVLP